MRVDGEIVRIEPGMQLDRYKVHDIELVIDRIEVEADNRFRVSESVKAALKSGNGVLMLYDFESDQRHSISAKTLMDPESGLAYDEPQPNTFSFNSPYGACAKCHGLGTIADIEEESLIIPNPKLSINKGGIAPLGQFRSNWTFTQLTGHGKADEVQPWRTQLKN